MLSGKRFDSACSVVFLLGAVVALEPLTNSGLPMVAGSSPASTPALLAILDHLALYVLPRD